MNSQKVHNNQFDFNEFCKDNQVEDLELFKSYLTEIWLDLRLRSDDVDSGVNKSTFLKVFLKTY